MRSPARALWWAGAATPASPPRAAPGGGRPALPPDGRRGRRRPRDAVGGGTPRAPGPVRVRGADRRLDALLRPVVDGARTADARVHVHRGRVARGHALRLLPRR